MSQQSVFFCGIDLQKSCKRNTCDTYETSVLGTNQPTALRKAQRILMNRNKTESISSQSTHHVINEYRLCLPHIQCQKCHSIGCIECIKAICNSMKYHNDHIKDQWYQSVTDQIAKNEQTEDVIGHCCEI